MLKAPFSKMILYIMLMKGLRTLPGASQRGLPECHWIGAPEDCNAEETQTPLHCRSSCISCIFSAVQGLGV